ncbi:hypothetical protein ACFE04_021704 [Oxalis oulophora]
MDTQTCESKISPLVTPSNELYAKTHCFHQQKVNCDIDEPNPKEDIEYLENPDDLFVLEEIGLIVKFRPFVRTFLEEASRYYAKNMARYLKTSTDESQTNGGLMRMLTVLKDLHTRFFNSGGSHDIRWKIVLRHLSALKGCRIHVADDDS